MALEDRKSALHRQRRLTPFLQPGDTCRLTIRGWWSDVHPPPWGEACQQHEWTYHSMPPCGCVCMCSKGAVTRNRRPKSIAMGMLTEPGS